MSDLVKRVLILGMASISWSIGTPTADAGAVAAYTFDNSTVSGATVADISGNGNNGVIYPGVMTHVPGKFGQAFGFSGSNSQVEAPAPYLLGNSFSISLWFNTSDLGQTDKYLVLQGSAGGNQDAILFGYVPNAVEFFPNASTGANVRVGSQITVSQPNTWYNIIYTYDGTNFVGYLNGSMVFDIAESFSLTATGPLYIGSATQAFPSNEFVGDIDDVGIFNTALTPSQVAYLQNNSVATLSFVPEPGSGTIIGIGVFTVVACSRRNVKRIFRRR